MWLSLIAKPGGRPRFLDLCRYINEHLRDDISMTPGVGASAWAAMWTQPARLAQSRPKWPSAGSGRRPGRHRERTCGRPSGYIDNGPKEFNVRVYGECLFAGGFAQTHHSQRVRAASATAPSGSGTSRRGSGLNDIRRISRVNGSPAVDWDHQAARTNGRPVAENVKKRIEQLKTSPGRRAWT